MAMHPDTEEHGFEGGENGLPKHKTGHEDPLKHKPEPDDEAQAMEEAQEEAAEERKEGGYQ